MDGFQLALIALIQGITEFLPISSQAHLILLPQAMGMEDQGQLFDIAVHVGTLFAVMIYFWRDIRDMIFGFFRLFARGGFDPAINPHGQLAILVVVATIPAIAMGFVVHSLDPAWLRAPETIMVTTIIFGIALWLADSYGRLDGQIERMTLNHAIMIGLAQMIALIPGTSRSGITMTAARMLGYSRFDAARFSLLLSIPVIAGAGVLGAKDVVEAGDLALTRDVLIAAGLSFLAALAAIALMMQWLKKASFLPFVVYRLALGVVIAAFLYL